MINNLPKVAEHTELFLFAEYSNVTALNQVTENIAFDSMECIYLTECN